MRQFRAFLAAGCLLTGATASFGAPLAAQEPAPAPPPPAQDAPVSMQEVLAAIGQLRQTFDLTDQRVREAVESPAPLPADRGRGLAAATEAMNQLVADMENLLAILPEEPPPPPSGSGGNSSSSKPDGNEPMPDGAKPGDQDGDSRPGEEENRGKAPPPTGPPLFGQPPANYGRWGVLPPRLQEALQNSAGTEVPSRYRRWLEEYHRRGQRPR